MRRRAPVDIQRSTEDVLSLSFLDVLCCGLGAAIYLFLVFSVMPHVGMAGTPDTPQDLLAGRDTRAAQVGVRLDIVDPVEVAPIFVALHVYGVQPGQAEDVIVRWEGFPEQLLLAHGPYDDASANRVTWLSPQVRGRRRARSVRCEIRDANGVLSGTRRVHVEVQAGGELVRLAGDVAMTTQLKLFQLDLTLEPEDWLTASAEGLNRVE